MCVVDDYYCTKCIQYAIIYSIDQFPTSRSDEALQIITTDLGQWWYDHLRASEDIEKTLKELLDTLNITGRTRSDQPNAIYFFAAASECIANDDFQILYNILTNSIDDFAEAYELARAKRMINNALRSSKISDIEANLLVKYLEFLHVESSPIDYRPRDWREVQAVV